MTPATPPAYAGSCRCGGFIKRRAIKDWQKAVDRPDLVARGAFPPPGPTPLCQACLEATPAYEAWRDRVEVGRAARGERWKLARAIVDAAYDVDRFADREDDAGLDFFEDSLRSLRVRLRLLTEYDRK